MNQEKTVLFEEPQLLKFTHAQKLLFHLDPGGSQHSLQNHSLF